jgi:hypothetical protein
MRNRQVSGLTDDVIVPHDSEVGIPNAKDFSYQTIELEGLAGEVRIDVDGRLTFTHKPGTTGELGYCLEACEAAKALQEGTYSSDDFDLYGDDVDGSWREMTLKIVNNQVVRVQEYADVLYEAQSEKVKPMPFLAEHDAGGNVRVTAAWLEWYKSVAGVNDEEANFVAHTAIGSVMNALSVHDQVEKLKEGRRK